MFREHFEDPAFPQAPGEPSPGPAKASLATLRMLPAGWGLCNGIAAVVSSVCEPEASSKSSAGNRGLRGFVSHALCEYSELLLQLINSAIPT